MGDHAIGEFDIAIVGAGMVGSALACALAQGLPRARIALLESQPHVPLNFPEQVDARVVALTDKSRQLLDSIGVWQAVAARRVSPYKHMHVWDAEGTGSVDFAAAEVQQQELGHIVENSVLVEALLEKIASFNNITLLCPARVSAIVAPDENINSISSFSLQLTLSDDRTLRASLVIAADGAESPVRTMAGLPTREWDYQHTAMVATVHTQAPHQHTAWQRFTSDGPLAFLPLQITPGDQHHCSIVWSANDALAKRLLALPPEQFNVRLAEAFEHRLGATEVVGSVHSFPLRQRHAIRYYRPGIVLCGDAAHTIHPLAGQGVNLGFGDAQVLAEELCRAQQHNIAFGDPAILARYQRRRMGENLGMMAAMEGFKRLFGSQLLPLRWLRNAGMQRVDHFKPIKNTIVRKAMGL